MRVFTINGKTVELDETLEYADFHVEGNKPVAHYVNWEWLLESLESGKIKWDCATVDNLRMLSRWVREAPRKRHFRKMRLEGFTVLSTEFFFEQEGGDKFIDALERSGQMAAKVLAVYGLEPVGPIKQDNPLRPTTTEEILGTDPLRN